MSTGRVSPVSRQVSESSVPRPQLQEEYYIPFEIKMYVISNDIVLANEIENILKYKSEQSKESFIKALSKNDELVNKTALVVKKIYDKSLEFITNVFNSIRLKHTNGWYVLLEPAPSMRPLIDVSSLDNYDFALVSTPGITVELKIKNFIYIHRRFIKYFIQYNANPTDKIMVFINKIRYLSTVDPRQVQLEV